MGGIVGEKGHSGPREAGKTACLYIFHFPGSRRAVDDDIPLEKTDDVKNFHYYPYFPDQTIGKPRENPICWEQEVSRTRWRGWFGRI